MTEDRKSCLIVVLKEEIALLMAPQCPSETFVFESINYKDLGYGDFIGFYDWLRNAEKRIIGVRFYPLKEVEFLCASIEHFPYVAIDSKTNILS